MNITQRIRSPKLFLARLFPVIILAFTVKNLIIDSHACLIKATTILRNPILPPGDKFVPLRPYLIGVRKVGYYTDQTSENPITDVNIMKDYQQAQYALSPTILDYYHGLNYELIIFNCSSKDCIEGKGGALRDHSFAPIINLNNGISLIRKLK